MSQRNFNHVLADGSILRPRLEKAAIGLSDADSEIARQALLKAEACLADGGLTPAERLRRAADAAQVLQKLGGAFAMAAARLGAYAGAQAPSGEAELNAASLILGLTLEALAKRRAA